MCIWILLTDAKLNLHEKKRDVKKGVNTNMTCNNPRYKKTKLFQGYIHSSTKDYCEFIIILFVGFLGRDETLISMFNELL